MDSGLEQQASEDRFVFPVGHGVLTQFDLLKYWKETRHST